MQKWTVPPSVSPVTLAYTAGFFDGEGTISIRQRSRAKGRDVEEYAVWLTACQKDRAVLDSLYADYGIGSVVFKGHRTYHNSLTNKQTAWSTHTWDLNANAAYQLIKAIRPYLRVKHRQADIAIAFHDAKMEWDRGRRVNGGGSKILAAPEELRQKYRAWTVEIQTLNGRKDVQAGPRAPRMSGPWPSVITSYIDLDDEP